MYKDTERFILCKGRKPAQLQRAESRLACITIIDKWIRNKINENKNLKNEESSHMIFLIFLQGLAMWVLAA